MKSKLHYTEKYLLNPMHPIEIILIGCGGTGSAVLTCLARLDHALVKLDHPGLFVTTYDDDTVSEANIGRQMFFTTDIGHNKAVVHTTRINRGFGLDWKAVPEKFSKKEGANIYISCVDTGKTREDISVVLKDYPTNSYYSPREKPYYWLDFGNSQKTGQVVLGTLQDIKQPKKSGGIKSLPTITDMFKNLSAEDKNEDQGPSCSMMESLNRQDLFINSTLANIGTGILWNMLKEFRIENHGAFLNLETLKMNPIKVKNHANN